MTINRKWHEKNKMPKNPYLEERIRWHLGHSEHCSCRPIPEKIVVEIKRKIKRAPVAQMDRASDYESAGRPFKSGRARQSFQ